MARLTMLSLAVACVLLGFLFSPTAAAPTTAPAATCGPPPQTGAYPPVDALPHCSTFPDPWLRSDGTRVSSTAEWSSHRGDMIKLLENYMYGHAPERPPVRSTLTASATVTEYCERAHSECNQAPSEKNVTGCEMRCLPLKTPQIQRNYTLRVGPSADKTWPFDVFVYLPAPANMYRPSVLLSVFATSSLCLW